MFDDDAGQDLDHPGYGLYLRQDDVVHFCQIFALQDQHSIIPPVHHMRIHDCFQAAQLIIGIPAFERCELDENQGFH